MDSIYRGLVLKDEVRISIIDTSSVLDHISKIHKFSLVAKQAMGRALTIGSYISHNLKGENSKFLIIIDGKGVLGKIYVSGYSGGRIKGYLENPNTATLSDNFVSLREGIGNDGLFSVVTDLALKTPNVSSTQLINGNLTDDYAYFLYKSDGVKNAVGLNVFDCEKEFKSVGIICEALPNATEETLFILEDIMTYFDDIALMIARDGIPDTLDYYFGHLSYKLLDKSDITFLCDCSKSADEIVYNMGYTEAMNLLDREGLIEIVCDYCLRTSVFDKARISKMFEDEKK